jgi:hypothetical protein
VWVFILFTGVICTVRADIIHVSVGAVSAVVVSVPLQSVGCSTMVTGRIRGREVSVGCWCSSGGGSVSWWGEGWFIAGCVWVCGLEGGQFAVVEWGGGVGGWIRVWVVSDVLVGVSVRWGGGYVASASPKG